MNGSFVEFLLVKGFIDYGVFVKLFFVKVSLNSLRLDFLLQIHSETTESFLKMRQ